MRGSSQRTAYFYAVSAVLCWSTVASAFKIALRSLEPIQLLFLASLTSTAALLVIVAFEGNIGLLLRQTRASWIRSACLGFLNPFIYYIVLFKAYDLLPAQLAQPLNYTWPILLSLLSIPLLGQRLTIGAIGGLLVSFAGVVVISTEGNVTALQFRNPLGCFLALSSGVVWALYWIYNLREQGDSSLRLLMNFICGSVYITPAVLLWTGMGPLSARSLASAGYVGLFEMSLTFVLWMRALRSSRDSAAVSNLAYLSPFLSLVFIYVILGERILVSSVLGLALIVAGILVQARWGIRRDS